MNIAGELTAKGKKIAVVISRTHEFITSKMLDGAKDCIIRHGGEENNIDVFWVPGSFEIPMVLQLLAQKKKYDGLICIGVVLKGATTHNQMISMEATKGVAQVVMSSGVPVGFGLTSAENLEQAIERAGTKVGNRGWDAAMSVLEMINLCATIDKL